MNAKAGAFAYTPEEILEASCRVIAVQNNGLWDRQSRIGAAARSYRERSGEDALRLTI